MAQLIWTEPALQDLNEIAEYIALDHVSAAKRLVKYVFKKVERLEAHPQSGRKPPELQRSPYRELIAGPCRVFYRIDDDKVFIIYVMRGERLLKAYLLKERAKALLGMPA